MAALNFNNLNYDKPKSYHRGKAYAQSKTANILFAAELNRRMRAAGLAIRANSVHPGVIETKLARTVVEGDFPLVGAWARKTIGQGAATQVYVATSPDLQGAGGLYFLDCVVAEPQPHARDREAAARLWDLSEKACGICLDEAIKSRL